MKNNFKKKITAILAVTLAAVISLTIPVSAIEVAGNGSGGGSSSTTEGGSYSLPVLGSSTSYCAGYRLTVITAKGERRADTSTIDVYCSNSDFANHIKNNTAYYSSGLFYKTEISSGFISGGGADRNIGDKKFDKNTAIWNDYLPQDATQMTNSAIGGVPYFKTDSGLIVFNDMCKKMGLSSSSALQNGNKVLIEPLFLLTIANTEYLLTVTEIGLYGFKMFGDVVPASSGDTGSWANIAYYTNAYWPMSCEVTEDLSYNGITIWYAAGTLTTGNPGRGSFGDLIKKGYGVAFAYNNTNPPIETIDVDLYPTNVTFLDAGGNEVTTLIEGQTYTPVFHFYNNGSVGVYARVAGWSYPLWKDIMYDYSGDTSTQIYIGAWSEYAITARESFTITPDLYYGESAKQLTDYQYWVNTILHELSIWLDCTSSYDASGTYVYVTESNTENNQATYTHNFLPRQPSISQWVVDEENADSSWITNNSIYGQWKLYSGEQISSYRWISNNSKFNINIVDNFKSFPGLNNSAFASSSDSGYFMANGKEGSAWSRQTGVIRAKNTNVNTHETLYLLDTAAEQSYNQATGFNYPDMNTISNNVTLNQQQFFTSTSYPSGNGNTMTVQWDNNSRILTLNGTDTTGFFNNTFDYYFKPWTRYRVTVEYVSGSVSANGYGNCFAFQGANEEGGRVYVDIPFPCCEAQGTGAVCTGFLDTDGKAQYTFRPWLHISSGSQLTFNNYRIKIKIEEVQGTDWDLQYTKNIQGYSVVPTDLQAQSLSLYDADTNVKINDGTVLKTGQRVYVETTYRNNTEVAVAAELMAVHNNNNNSYYWNSDDGSLSSRVQRVTSSVSNSEFKESLVIAPNQYVTVRSNTFEISAVPHNKITLSAYIYIKGLTGNTEYEYVTTNNVISKAYVIETPFKPTVVQANSEYRRGITVITSFNIKNDSYSDFGTQTDIDNIGVLSAKLKVYRTSSLTGTPIADVDCVYAVPGNGQSTLVWFEWTVSTDSPDKLYAEMVCDNNNIYSSSEFKDNGNNSKNTYCTFNIVQPKVMSTPDTTFAKKAPYWYEDGASSASVPSKATGLNLVYNQEAGQIKGSTSWSYYVANGNSLKLVTESATLMGSSVDLIPDGTLSAYVGYDNKWNIKAGYGFKIDTEFKENVHSTNIQSGYAVFPEFLYKIADNNSSVNGYTNGAGTRVGFEGVLNKYPLCGGEYATYSTFEKTSNGKLIFPNNDSSHTPTHFIPVWYPNSDYIVNCYVADCWTPGGMLSGEIRSSVIHVNGNMYDDYRVSEK